MPAPEIWGPAVWNLFHTLIEQLNEDAFQFIAPHLYSQFVRICKFLPCPDCASDATNFLAKVNLSNIKSKIEFRNTFYLFHNWVNARKRKQLFNYGNILIYSKYNVIVVINKFLSVYHTKGNMKMLNESFQRSLIVSTFKSWFTSVIGAFTPRPTVEQPIPIEVKEEPIVEEEVKEEHVIHEEVTALAEKSEVPATEEVKAEESEVPVAEEVIKAEESKVHMEDEQSIIEEVKVVAEESEVPIIEEVKVVADVSEVPVVQEVKPKKDKKGKK